MSGCDRGHAKDLFSRVLSLPLIFLVRSYQVVLSPLFGNCCRFTPSCSNYMIEALEVHGPVKGTLLGVWRILRCHPFGAKGYDPVPPKNFWKVVKNEQD